MDQLDPIEVSVLVCFFGAPLWGVLDALRIPRRAWEAAGRSKSFWVALQLLTLYPGTLAYAAAVRRDVLFFLAPRSPDWDEVEQSDG